jgi:hypothetical protein
MNLLPVIQKTTALIQSGDIVGAEYELERLAEVEGSTALISAIDQIAPKVLLTLVREYDASKMSVVNLVITPEQFARTMVLERLYGDHTNDQLRGMMNAIIFRDEDQTGNFLQALADEDKGIETLADYLMDRFEPICFFIVHGVFNPHDCQRHDDEAVEELKESGYFDHVPNKISREEAQDHDWMEMVWVLAHGHDDILREVMDLLGARWRKWQLLGDDDSGYSLPPTTDTAQDEESAI